MRYNTSMGKIGIFGGTFDPVHNQHQMLAQKAIQQLGLDRLYVVPTFLPPHKDGYLPTSGEIRLEMLRAAFRDEKAVLVSDYELKQGGKSYSYLTVSHFAEMHEGDSLWFVLGEDMFENFPKWKYPEKIIGKARIAVVKRDGSGVSFKKAKKAFEKITKNYDVLPFCGKEVSSTEIRIRTALGLSLDGLVDKEVQGIIARHGLFADERVQKVKDFLKPSRLEHTAGVVEVAVGLAKRLGVDQDKTFLAAAIHDLAKYRRAEDYADFEMPIGVPAPVKHAFLGAYLAKTELGITDEEVLDAVTYHTSGRAKMTTLEKIVYLADMVEKNREYRGVDKLRKLLEKDFERAFCAAIKQSYRFLLKTKRKDQIFPLTKEAYEYYCRQRGRQ